MSPLNFIIVQHEDCTTPGSTILWLEKNKMEYRIVRPDKGDIFPEITRHMRVIICGGIPNVDQETQFPWLIGEKKWIAELLQSKTPVVGLCLGAQLLADVMGSEVFKSEYWEYGWQPLNLSSEFTQWMGAPETSGRAVFQCHGYQFHLPQGMTSLGGSIPTACQGFLKDQSVLAFQFHPEADQAWIDLCVDVSKPKGPYCQLVTDIPQSTNRFLDNNQNWYFSMLDRFFLNPA